MSGVPGVPFTTTINGKQCTAIPKRAPPGNDQKPTTSSKAAESTSQPPPDEPPATTEAPRPPSPPPPPPPSNNNPPPADTSTRQDQPDQNTERTTSSSTSTSQPPATSEPPRPAPPAPPAPPRPPPPPPSSSSSSSSSSSRTRTTSTIQPPPPPAEQTSSAVPSTQSAAPLPDSSSSSSAAPSLVVPLPVGPPSRSDSTVTTLPPSIAPPASESLESSAPLFLDTSPPPPLPTTTDSVLTTTGINGLVTTIGIDNSRTSSQPDRETTSDVEGQAGVGLSQSSSSLPSKGVIIGSTVGAAALIGLIAFLLWLFRKRSADKKRRSTLLTPLNMPRVVEKPRVYEFDAGSVGPTPRSEKFAAALTSNFKSFGRAFRSKTSAAQSGRVDSQYMENSPSRGPLAMAGGAVLSTKDRYRDWWSRLGEDAKFNWRVRHDPYAAASRYPNLSSSDNKQDFRGLVDISEQEAQRRGSRGSSHSSANSRDHFLAGLNLDLKSGAAADPFSDSNAVPGQATRGYRSRPTSQSFDAAIQIPPLTVQPPSSYVADVQRSRGRTMSGGAGGSRPGSLASNGRPGYRSGQSVDFDTTRRNKFRSDPFDLELENRKLPTDSDVANMPNLKAGLSMSSRLAASSRYQSGVSAVSAGSFKSVSVNSIGTGDWSDPGPDVGPAGVRREGSVSSNTSKASGNAIGRAM